MHKGSVEGEKEQQQQKERKKKKQTHKKTENLKSHVTETTSLHNIGT